MTKELSPLEALERLRNTLLVEGYWQDVLQDVAIIETALKDYEKKTKLAKEYADVNNVAKRLKAFEIIKERNIDTTLIKTSKDYDDYCSDFAVKVLTLKDEKLLGNGKGINEQEYNLLKEVLR